MDCSVLHIEHIFLYCVSNFCQVIDAVDVVTMVCMYVHVLVSIYIHFTLFLLIVAIIQKLPPVKCNIVEARSRLGERAVELNKAAADVVIAATSTSTEQIAPASRRFSRAYEDFVETGLEAASAAAASGDSAVQAEVVSGLRGVSTVASRLLMATKALLVDPNASDAKNQLTAAARYIL